MKRFFFCFTISLLLTSCGSLNLDKTWYLVGGNKKMILNLEENKMSLLEGSQLIFKGSLHDKASSGHNVFATLHLESLGKMYQQKYKDIKTLKLTYEKIDDSHLKVFMKGFSKTSYLFTDEDETQTLDPSIGRILFDTEARDFYHNNQSYDNVIKAYSVTVKSLMEEDFAENDSDKKEVVLKNNIKQDISNLYDLKEQTGYMIDSSKPYLLEYEAKKDGQVLSNALDIKAILINGVNSSNAFQTDAYNRPKKVTFYFSSVYGGGLGLNKNKFNGKKISITLPDTKKPIVIAFYKGFKAKNILVSVDSYYLGGQDETAIFDLVFFSTPAR